MKRIRHSWIYKVGKCITITPRFIRRFVRCVFRHGLKYTFTISLRELREGRLLSKKPKFSIIVPVYNVEPYLSYCLNTIVEQTLRDIEIICVNDGSTDQSLKILQAYAREDDRIKIINKPNGGLSSARNAALPVAEGEYILFVDSDDMICKYTCDRLYREILQKAPDVIIFGTEIFPGAVMKPDRGWLEWTLAVNPVYYDKIVLMRCFWERASKPYVYNKCFKNSTLKKTKLVLMSR